jgi:hypothetical protein
LLSKSKREDEESVASEEEHDESEKSSLFGSKQSSNSPLLEGDEGEDKMKK